MRLFLPSGRTGSRGAASPIPERRHTGVLTNGERDGIIKPNERLFFNLSRQSPKSVSAPRTVRVPRSDNRQPELLDAAAALFAQRGYAATSMRDIALAVKMLPGSMYYHFASKEELLVAVYEAGVGELAAAVRTASRADPDVDPWQRLEAACRAHLETVLRSSDYAQVLIRVHPQDVPAAADRLRELRAGYEEAFRALIAALPLPAVADRRMLRLMLLGALNWARVWFDPAGRQTPRSLAAGFVSFLKEAQDA